MVHLILMIVGVLHGNSASYNYVREFLSHPLQTWYERMQIVLNIIILITVLEPIMMNIMNV